MKLQELQSRTGDLPDLLLGGDVLGGDDRGPLCSFNCESLSARDGEILASQVVGRLDPRTHPALGLMLIGALRRAPSYLVVDLTGVTFCHIRGLALLTDIARTAAVNETGYAVSGLPAQLNRADKTLSTHVQPMRYHSAAAAVTAIRAGRVAHAPDRGHLGTNAASREVAPRPPHSQPALQASIRSDQGVPANMTPRATAGVTTAGALARPTARGGTKPMLQEPRPRGEALLVGLFTLIPMLALLAAVPLAWGWGLSWIDVGLGVGFYFLSGLGVTVGFHRYFTHRAFTANRALRNGLAIAGSLAVQGDVITWVADHRRHHAYADKAGDPHSPWLFGTTPVALAKGFFHAHMGWLFSRDRTNAARFTPDLLADADICRIARAFPLWTVVSLLTPAVAGGLISMSWWGAATGFFWAGLVRVALLHHITWSINSICHMIGTRPFTARGKATNVWPLAVASMGESWHNLHHADPTCARHGVGPGQIDMSARVIWALERLGWATRVRWPTATRLAQLSAARAS